MMLGLQELTGAVGGSPEVVSPAVAVCLLGPIDVVVDVRPRAVCGLRRRALLAALALKPRVVVSSDRLIDVVWSGRAPATAQNTLQAHVSYLRRALGLRHAIVARAPGYVLDLHGKCTDVQVAEALITDSQRAADPRKVAKLLRQALGMWRGRSLAELRDLAWFTDESKRLENMRRTAQRALIEAQMTLGEHACLVGELEHLSEQHPFDEDLHRQLMLALYRSGRQADALAVYRRLHSRLDADLGIEPAAKLRDLQVGILRQESTLDLHTTGTMAS